MPKITDLSNKIKALKDAREILHEEYTKTDFHKKREAQPQESVPPSPEDEEILKLLTAIHQIDVHIKRLQDEQFSILKKNE
jgi:hypothetical protein